MNKKTYIISLFALVFIIAITPGCLKKDITDPNNPELDVFLENASLEKLSNIVTGTESAMRDNYNFYIEDAGVIGREHYRFSNADPRYSQDLLGASSAILDNNGFYVTNPWVARYRCVKNANILIDAAKKSTKVSESQRNGFYGFAKTIKAYQLLLNLNLTYNNGIRVNTEDPDHLGPLVKKEEALTFIATLLNEAETNLTASGANFGFVLSSGFADFNTPVKFLKFNRALAARVAVYQGKWNEALNYLSKSFLDISSKNFNAGVYMTFGENTGDQVNRLYTPQNASGEVRLAHPSYAKDIAPGDDRINKAPKRIDTLTQKDLISDRDVYIYTSRTAPISIIRNEELILIYAEANIQANNLPEAITALNVIRTGHNVLPYAGNVSKDDLINEMLYQRRYSLFFEGHRWIDLRRYNRLGELSIDRPGDDVWTEFPTPLIELNN